MSDGVPPSGDTPEPDPKVIFGTLVAALRSEVSSILSSETVNGSLRYTDDGISLFSEGSWKASVWNPAVGGSTIEITCAQGQGERWRVMVSPLDPDWPMFVLHWPSDGFEVTLRAAVANLRTAPGSN